MTEKTTPQTISDLDNTLDIHLKFLDKMAQEHNKCMNAIGTYIVRMENHLRWVALGVKIGLVMMGLSMFMLVASLG